MNKLWKEFLEKGKLDDCPIIDMHAHMGFFYGSHIPYAYPEKVIQRMERAGVKLSIVIPNLALYDPDGANRHTIEVVERYPERFKGYCAINPNYPDVIKKDLESYEKYTHIYKGFKLLSDYHLVALSDERYRMVFEYADSNGSIILAHTWARSIYDGSEEVEKILKKYKKIRFIAGHSLHDWDKMIEFVKTYDNVYIDLCAVLDDRGPLEKFVDALGADRILYGTDFPWFDHHYYIGAVLGSGISEEDSRKIFYKNAEKLFSVKVS
ncbi:MAG: amidohydrolase family protein [bacterium]|nr:amidohydrolase family protein [bacterium]